MGTVEQRMHVSFRCYDADDDQVISEEELVLVLMNVPKTIKARYGPSHGIENRNMSEIIEMKQ